MKVTHSEHSEHHLGTAGLNGDCADGGGGGGEVGELLGIGVTLRHLVLSRKAPRGPSLSIGRSHIRQGSWKSHGFSRGHDEGKCVDVAVVVVER